MFHLDRLSHQLPVSFVTSLKDHRLEPDFSEHCICTSWNFLSHRFESTWVWEPWTLTSGLLSNSKPTAGSCPPSTWSAPRCAVRLKCIVFYFFSYRFLSRISSPGLCWQWSERPQVFFQPSCLCGRGSPPSDVKSSTVAKTGPRLVFNKNKISSARQCNGHLNSLFVGENRKVDGANNVILPQNINVAFPYYQDGHQVSLPLW